MALKYILALSSILGLALAQKTPGGIITSSMDPSSFGNVDVIYTTNLNLTVAVNFNLRILYGFVDLTMKAK